MHHQYICTNNATVCLSWATFCIIWTLFACLVLSCIHYTLRWYDFNNFDQNENLNLVLQSTRFFTVFVDTLKEFEVKHLFLYLLFRRTKIPPFTIFFVNHETIFVWTISDNLSFSFDTNRVHDNCHMTIFGCLNRSTLLYILYSVHTWLLWAGTSWAHGNIRHALLVVPARAKTIPHNQIRWLAAACLHC